MNALAKKYARAFFNLFKDALSVSSIDRCKEFVQFMQDRRRALYYMQLSLLSDMIKQQIILDELARFRLDKIFRRLVDLLTAHKNLYLIADIISVLIELYAHYNNRIEFTALSAHALTDKQLHVIEQFLVQKTGKTIVLTPRIDKELIAGIKLSSATLRWEYSVRRQLRALNKLL
jgi:ATP synthase F1 delta subunit